MRTRQIVVSLHDVAPPFEDEIRRQLDALAAIGVRRCVLKVVPNWHGAHPLSDASSLVDLLADQQRAGSELVLHGLEHRVRGPLRGPALLRLRAGLFAGDAAEFLTLTRTEAEQAVQQGLELFDRAGLAAPTSFCAPGWLLAPDLIPVLACNGIDRIVGMLSLRDLNDPRRWLLPAAGHMGVSPLYEAGVGLGNRLVWLACGRATLMKIFLHPQGSGRSGAARRVLDTIARLVEDGWQPATYGDIVGSLPVTQDAG